jgi:hypothetical protein
MSKTAETRDPIQHVGKHADRMEHPCQSTDREKAFADAWSATNNPPEFLNYGLGTLDYLLHVTEGPVTEESLGIWDHRLTRTGNLTQEEATAAATVMQWLGTNVGFCMLEEALKACGYTLNRRKDAA